MNLTIRSFDAYCEDGPPRLVLDGTGGVRVYATFGDGVYVNPQAHYRSAVKTAAARMSTDDLADLVGDLLALLPAEDRADTILGVVSSFHTPRVIVDPRDEPEPPA